MRRRSISTQGVKTGLSRLWRGLRILLMFVLSVSRIRGNGQDGFRSYGSVVGEEGTIPLVAYSGLD